jgi:hypothetical protein
MDADDSKPLAAFGFLTVLETREHGLFGGYLVLSPLGRPLEFRCSTPVAASRAQQILYGPTLRPYLFADVIGQTLVAGAALPVAAILTDQRDMLPLAVLRPEAVVYVEPLSTVGRDDAPPTNVLGIAHALSFALNGHRLTVAASDAGAIDRFREILDPLVAHVELTEPFDRIRAALIEAQQASGEGATLSHDQASAA